MKKLHGNRVCLDLPEQPIHKVEISPELKKQLEAEKIKQYDKLKVYAVADNVKELFSPGDEVMVDPSGLQKGTVIEIGDKKKIIVSSYDIAVTW